MTFVRMLLAYGILFCLSFFISSNIEEILAGSGYVFLALALLLFGLLLAASNDLSRFLRPNAAAWLLLVFLVYFAVKFFFESGDFEETKQVTIGTSGGVVFALGVGLVSAYALATIHELRSRRVLDMLSLLLGFSYLLFVLSISWSALQEHSANVRTDLFLIEDQEGYYQRVGDLVFMQTMLIASLSTVLLTTAPVLRLFRSLPEIFLILIIAGIFGFTSQLVGSNSGLVATTGFVFVYLVSFFVVYTGGVVSRNLNVGFAAMLSGPLATRILVGSALMGVAIAVFGAVGLRLLDIDFDMLRISGFGTGEVSSIDARATFFSENFLEHFFYSPLFGNTQVDKLTSGDGTYVHSLLALLPHLGMIGFSIFLAVIWSVYREISPSGGKDASIYGSRQYALYRLMALATVLAMGTYSAFFTWMPLWFALGMFGEWFYEPDPEVA